MKCTADGGACPRPPGPLGPRPRLAVESLADLGLGEEEIARYFRVPPDVIRGLRQTAPPPGRLIDRQG